MGREMCSADELAAIHRATLPDRHGREDARLRAGYWLTTGGVWLSFGVLIWLVVGRGGGPLEAFVLLTALVLTGVAQTYFAWRLAAAEDGQDVDERAGGGAR